MPSISCAGQEIDKEKPGADEINLPIIAPRRKLAAHSPLLGRQKHFARSETRTHDFDLPLTKEQIRKEQRDCHFCQLAKFSTYERYPITICNDVDDSTLPSDFSFIERSILCDGVRAAEEAFRTGCECQEDQDCERIGCHCLQDMDIPEQSPGPRTKIHAYRSRGSNRDCLRQHLLDSREPIYECHDKCQCSSECRNRVVERGRRVPLEIFRTFDGRGWGKLKRLVTYPNEGADNKGVRSTVDIVKGQYVDKYVGEIITAEEAQRRREESDVAERKDVYLFALDKFSDPNSMDPRLSGPPYEVDGEFKSGPTRYINHSCDPNLRSFARVGDHADKHIHDLALFAIDDIAAGEELTFDYVDGMDTDPVEDAKDSGKREEMTKCLCGSENCRGFLW
ncbi:MAG: hypothetical protein M1818_005252 [Claussenomyces sp. TS43310]|nr:MAG: hypothetical protein M1818_005252 [Claussenomyces sp. TS43310]